MTNNSDPRAVAAYIESRRSRAKKAKLSTLCDAIPWAEIPDYDSGESMVTVTVAEYVAELEARDDPEAAHMLAQIQARRG